MTVKIKRGETFDPQSILELVKGSINYDLEVIRSAFRDQFRSDATYYDDDLWICEIFKDHVVVSSRTLAVDEFYKIMYTSTVEDNAIIVQFDARETWQVVELAYNPQTRPTPLHELRRNDSGRFLWEFAPGAMQFVEAEKNKPAGIVVEGLMQADVINLNDRVYSANVIDDALALLKSTLNQSNGQSRLMLYGEDSHPDQPSMQGTIIKWESITFDGDLVSIAGHFTRSEAATAVADLMRNDQIVPGGSIRAYGESHTDTIKQTQVEVIDWFVITGVDLVMRPGFQNFAILTEALKPAKPAVEKPPKPDEVIPMDPQEFLKLLEANADVVRGMFDAQGDPPDETALNELQERVRTILKIDQNADLAVALKTAADASTRLKEIEHTQNVATWITEATADLPYAADILTTLQEAIRNAHPATQEAVQTLLEVKRTEYDQIAATAVLHARGYRAGGPAINVLGPVVETELQIAEYLQPAYEVFEQVSIRGKATRRDLAHPDASINQKFARRYLELYDAKYKHELIQEFNTWQHWKENLTTSVLDLPYGVMRAVIEEAFPTLIALSIFDVDLTDQSPTRIHFEVYNRDTDTEVTVTDEAATSSDGAYVALNGARINPGSIVVTGTAGTPVYVEHVDYVIDHIEGRLFTIVAGSIGDSTTLEVDYTYTDMRRGEMLAIRKAHREITSAILDIAADRLATLVSNEAVVFARSQLGWDPVARSIAGLIRDVSEYIDQGILNFALSTIASTPGSVTGTWTSASETLDDLVDRLGEARVLLGNRFYSPEAFVMSLTNSDTLSNWDGFTRAGSRTDATLLATGYVGRVKGLPVFETSQFPDGHIMCVVSELIQHRVFQPMTLKGPFPAYDSSGELLPATQSYIEEFNGTDAPVANKGTAIIMA